MKRVGNLNGFGKQTDETKKAMTKALSALTRLGKKGHKSRAGVIRVMVNGCYFEYQVVSHKWQSTYESGARPWNSATSLRGFLLAAEVLEDRRKSYTLYLDQYAPDDHIFFGKHRGLTITELRDVDRDFYDKLDYEGRINRPAEMQAHEYNCGNCGKVEIERVTDKSSWMSNFVQSMKAKKWRAANATIYCCAKCEKEGKAAS